MNSLKHKKNTESRSIEILFNDNQMCCGICVENFLSNYVLCVMNYQRLEKIRRLLKIKEDQRIALRDLDLINKIISGEMELPNEVVKQAIKIWPVNERDFYIIFDDSIFLANSMVSYYKFLNNLTNISY